MKRFTLFIYHFKNENSYFYSLKYTRIYFSICSDIFYIYFLFFYSIVIIYLLFVLFDSIIYIYIYC